jgi:hypothetical protein
MRTTHHSARTAPRAPLRAHNSARTAPLAGPLPHVPPAARMRVGDKAPPLIPPLTNPLPPPSISSGRVGGRKEMQLPAVPGPVQLARLALRLPGRPATAACGQWSGRRTAACRPGPRLQAQPAAAGPARGCRSGQYIYIYGVDCGCKASLFWQRKEHKSDRTK